LKPLPFLHFLAYVFRNELQKRHRTSIASYFNVQLYSLFIQISRLLVKMIDMNMHRIIKMQLQDALALLFCATERLNALEGA